MRQTRNCLDKCQDGEEESTDRLPQRIDGDDKVCHRRGEEDDDEQDRTETVL
jgi:hypothetical protein